MISFAENIRFFGSNEAPHSVLADPSDMRGLSDASDAHFFTQLPFGNFLGNLLQVRGTNKVMGLLAHALQTGLTRIGIGGIPAFLALGAALAGGGQALTWFTSGKKTQNHNNNTALTLATIYASMGAAVLAGSTSPFLGDVLGEIASSAIQTGARLWQGGLASPTDALRFFGGSLKQGVWNILMSTGSGSGRKRINETTSLVATPERTTPTPRIEIETTLPDNIRHGSVGYYYSKYVEGTPPHNSNKTENTNHPERAEDDPDITAEVIQPNSHIPIDTRFLMYDFLGLDPTNSAHHRLVADLWTRWDTHPRTQARLSFDEKIAFVEKEAVLQSLEIINPEEALRLRSLPEAGIDAALPQATRQIVENIQKAIILQPWIISEYRLNYNTNIAISARFAKEVLHTQQSDIVWAENTLRSWTDGSKLVTNPATTFLYKRISAKIVFEGGEIYVTSERGPQKLANEDGVVVLVTDDKIEIYVTDGMGGSRGTESTIETTKILAFGATNPLEALNQAHDGVVNYSNNNFSLDQKIPGGTLNAVHLINGNIDSLSVGDSQVALIDNGAIIAISDNHSYRGRLTQSIGGNINNPSRISGPLDRRVLAIFTDGAYKTMNQAEIATSVFKNGANNASPIILDLAREMGETDDITSVYLKAA